MKIMKVYKNCNKKPWYPHTGWVSYQHTSGPSLLYFDPWNKPLDLKVGEKRPIKEECTKLTVKYSYWLSSTHCVNQQGMPCTHFGWIRVPCNGILIISHKAQLCNWKVFEYGMFIPTMIFSICHWHFSSLHSYRVLRGVQARTGASRWAIRVHWSHSSFTIHDVQHNEE